MKKIILLVLIAGVAVAAYSQRRSLFWLYWAARNRPPEIRFQEYRKDRVSIRHVPSLQKDAPRIAETILANLRDAEKITGARLDLLNVRLYRTFEEKGADVRDIYVAHADASDNTVYCLVSDRYDGTRERVEFELLLRECCGKAAGPELSRAAAAALSGTWNQKNLDEWKRFLLERGFGGESAFDGGCSEFARIPFLAMYFLMLQKNYGRETFLEYYRTGNPPAGTVARFEESLQETVPARSAAPATPLFQKGISYAYENGYSEGYATRKSARSLDELKSIGVEWVASIPYGFMRAPDSTEVRWTGHSIFTESDESLFALADDARARGMKVMLKPQLWISHNAWPGMVDFPDEASWQKWFDSYEKWILHYALIAELSGARVFCIGTELVKTTLQHPDKWRALIARVREVYHGQITYAANYGREFEQLQFWDALDYMGLDNYYAVRDNAQQGTDSIQQGFEKQKEKIRAVVSRWNKPLLFTEIGYHANPGAGMGSKEDEIPGYDEKMQAACYEAALRVYWHEPWFSGMYWKWFSNPDDRGVNADVHSPHGRLAEGVLRRWYSKAR